MAGRDLRNPPSPMAHRPEDDTNCNYHLTLPARSVFFLCISPAYTLSNPDFAHLRDQVGRFYD